MRWNDTDRQSGSDSLHRLIGNVGRSPKAIWYRLTEACLSAHVILYAPCLYVQCVPLICLRHSFCSCAQLVMHAFQRLTRFVSRFVAFASFRHLLQVAQLSQRDRAARRVLVMAQSGRLKLGDNIYRYYKSTEGDQKSVIKMAAAYKTYAGIYLHPP